MQTKALKSMLAKRLFGFAIFFKHVSLPQICATFFALRPPKVQRLEQQETALCCIQIAPFLSRSLPPLQLFQAIITPARPAQLEVPSGAKKRDRGRAHASSLSPRLAIEPAAEAFCAITPLLKPVRENWKWRGKKGLMKQKVSCLVLSFPFWWPQIFGLCM